MPIIVNNPNGTDSGSGYVIGIIVAIILIILFFVFMLPAMRGDTTPNTSGTYTPVDSQSAPNNSTTNYNSTTTINLRGSATSSR